MSEKIVYVANFIATIKGNVDNEKLSDADFRDLIRVTLPIVRIYGDHQCQECGSDINFHGYCDLGCDK